MTYLRITFHMYSNNTYKTIAKISVRKYSQSRHMFIAHSVNELL